MSTPHPTPAKAAFNELLLARFSIPHTGGRPNNILTVGKGAGPEVHPAGARASRGYAGPLPKAAANWFVGRGAPSP